MYYFDGFKTAHTRQRPNLLEYAHTVALFLFQNFEGVVTCKKTDTLISIMDKIVKAEVHRLVIVDDDNKVEGMISLSDILFYLVLKPCGK